MLRFFNRPWYEPPTSWHDTETTGLRIGHDKAVSAAIVRFENQKPVAEISSYLDPGMPIPAEATAIHGVTNEMVKWAPTIEQFYARKDVLELIDGTQPGAYNAPFDREFIPPIIDPWDWPWLDTLSFIRKFHRYVKGSKRHRLTAVCEREKIVLIDAHTAPADARAAGLLFYTLGAKIPPNYTMGKLLGWQKRIEAAEWERYHAWKASLPPLPDKEKNEEGNQGPTVSNSSGDNNQD